VYTLLALSIYVLFGFHSSAYCGLAPFAADPAGISTDAAARHGHMNVMTAHVVFVASNVLFAFNPDYLSLSLYMHIYICIYIYIYDYKY